MYPNNPIGGQNTGSQNDPNLNRRKKVGEEKEQNTHIQHIAQTTLPIPTSLVGGEQRKIVGSVSNPPSHLATPPPVNMFQPPVNMYPPPVNMQQPPVNLYDIYQLPVNMYDTNHPSQNRSLPNIYDRPQSEEEGRKKVGGGGQQTQQTPSSKGEERKKVPS